MCAWGCVCVAFPGPLLTRPSLPARSAQDAVSVALGGCVPRGELPQLAPDGGGLAGERLLLEDPLTGERASERGPAQRGWGLQASCAGRRAAGWLCLHPGIIPPVSVAPHFEHTAVS